METGRPQWEVCGLSPEPFYLSTIDHLSSTVGHCCEGDSTVGLVEGLMAADRVEHLWIVM